jgi:hypothetical protein
MVPGTDPSKMFGSAFAERNAPPTAAEQWQEKEVLRKAAARPRGYTKADIRNMTPREAAEAAARHRRETGGYEARGYSSDIIGDLQDRALRQGSISAHETDPVVRGLAHGRKNYPITTATAEFAGGLIPGVSSAISLADLKMIDDPAKEAAARKRLYTDVALDLIPGGSEYRYAGELAGASGDVSALYDIGKNVAEKWGERPSAEEWADPGPDSSRLALLDKDLRPK